MTWEVFQTVWPVLLGLCYILFTCVLLVLASHSGRAISFHDRIRESKALRRDYLKALARRKTQ